MSRELKKQEARSAKVKKAWETRRAGKSKALSVIFSEGVSGDPNTPIRGQLLDRAKSLTLGDRNASYGDPLPNFEAIAALKATFWSHAAISSILHRNTAMGHSIDMVLNCLGRLASAPSLESALNEDKFIDGANYLVIACEVGKRSQ